VGNAVSEVWFTMKKAEKQKIGETKNAEINNVVYMELYSGAKMVNDKYLKTNVRSKNREFTVFVITLL
jgi:hypothetical protein